MAKDTGFTFQELSEVLKYDGQAGEFIWLATINSRAKSGQRAGVWQRMQNGKDYYSITYKGRKISGSQLAWLLHYGEWPDRSVFFVDKNSRNLQISNLKLADHKAIRVTKEDGTVGYEMTREQVRHYGLVRNYNISLTEYARMFSEQNGVCAICSQPESSKMPGRKTDASEPRVRDLSVDHDHKTGAVRGLLCNSCNHMLGEAKDNEQVLLAGADYIRRHRVGE